MKRKSIKRVSAKRKVHYQLQDKLKAITHLKPKLFKEAVLVHLHKLV